MGVKIDPDKKAPAQQGIRLNLPKKGVPIIQNDSTGKSVLRREISLVGKNLSIKKVLILQCGVVRIGNQSDAVPSTGSELRLLRESDNPYDKWAVKVCTPEGISLGYLPSWKNQSLARLMDAGRTIRAYVTDPEKESIQYGEYPAYRYSQNEDQALTVSAYLEVIMNTEE